MKSKIGFLVALVILIFFSANVSIAQNLDHYERVEQKLVAPPFLPVHKQVVTTPPKIIQIRMVIEEKEIEIEKGVFVHVFTFNGSVPGPIIVAHQNDYIELLLINPTKNTLLHNIDFHAATGALGGGEITKISPGQEVVIRFKADRVGVFVYHCAPGGLMTPWHVVHGMSGAIMILPRDGLKDGNGKLITYTKAFYIGEQDYYVPKNSQGKYKRYKTPLEGFNDELEVMKTLTPSHIVFNGIKGSLTGKNALQSKVGDTVLIIHSQANRQSYPHLIGGHGDYVWERGNFSDPPLTNLESWVIGAGSAGAAIYTFKQPGLYVYLSHNLIEAVLLGAVAQFEVSGSWDDDLMKQIKKPSAIKL